MTVDREAIMVRARAHLEKNPHHDLMCQMIALVVAVEAQRDAAVQRESEERSIANGWAQRAKVAEERAVGAEGECRAYSARIDQLEAAMMTPRTPGAPWCETAMDRIRRENESAARSAREPV